MPVQYYIPFVKNNVHPTDIKYILDMFMWGKIIGIGITQKNTHKSAVITFEELTPRLNEINKIISLNQQIKIKYSPYEFWWFKFHLNCLSPNVPQKQVFTDLPPVINVCLDPDYDSDSDSEE